MVKKRKKQDGSNKITQNLRKVQSNKINCWHKSKIKIKKSKKMSSRFILITETKVNSVVCIKLTNKICKKFTIGQRKTPTLKIVDQVY